MENGTRKRYFRFKGRNEYKQMVGFRHTHCTLLFEAGVPLPDVRDRLGHGSISVTVDIYNHITRNKQQKTLDSFVSYFSNK